MSYFKKFTDFLGGIACFIASVFLISRYMEFTPLKPEELEEGVEVKSKLCQFLLGESDKDYRQYLILVFLLVFSISSASDLEISAGYVLLNESSVLSSL